MNEKNLRDENERLRHELAELREDRNALHKMLCSMLPIEETQPTAEDLKQMRDGNVSIVDLLHDPRFCEKEPVNGTCMIGKSKVNHS